MRKAREPQGRASQTHASQTKDAKSIASQIKSQLTTARDVALIKETRQNAAIVQAGVIPRTEILANRRAAWSFIEYTAAKAGFETDKFDDILARNQVAMRSYGDAQMSAAVKQSSSVKKSFIQAIDGRRRALEGLISVAQPSGPVRVVLDSPFLIWKTQGIQLMDSTVVPWNSSAKITLDSGKTFGSEELGFYFLWENPSNRFAVIEVHGFLVFNGAINANQGGGFWPGDRYASLGVAGRLHVFEWWNQPPTEPLFETSQLQQVDTVTATGGGFGDVGDLESKNVFRGVDLSYSLFIVPPLSVVVFEVAGALTYGTGTDGGHVSADFNSGDFEIICPFLSIAILS